MANDEARMTNDDAKGLPESRRYDLAERTAQFGEQLIRFARKIKPDPVTIPLIRQLVRSATSVGAN
jgi:hypothetical protein